MYTIDLIKSIMNQFADLVCNCTPEQLNTIPKGFNNNIMWNYGHTVVSGYGLAFISSGINPSVNIPLGSKFRKGTKPESLVTEEEINVIKKLANDFPAALEEVIKEGRFQNVTSYTTQTFGIPTNTLDDVLTTIAAHSTLHLQTAKMYNRILNS